MSTFSWKQKWLAIAPKPFAALSMCGSAYIVKHVLTSSKRRSSVYHRLLLALSVFDFFVTFTIFMGTWSIPAGTPGVYLASGNTFTCSAQGFFIQSLGVGTPIYNASLAVYYYLKVKCGWTETKLKNAEKWLHAIPLVFSFSTAIAGAVLKLYNNAQLWCWIAPPAANANLYRMVFFYGPIWASILLTTAVMISMAWAVLQQERSTDKHNLRASLRRSRKNTRKVANQAMLYVAAFYITWLFPSCTRISQMVHGSAHFAFIALFTIFMPLQGFFNCCVYFRPRYLRYRQQFPGKSIGQVLMEGARSAARHRESMFHINGKLKSTLSLRFSLSRQSSSGAKFTNGEEDIESNFRDENIDREESVPKNANNSQG